MRKARYQSTSRVGGLLRGAGVFFLLLSVPALSLLCPAPSLADGYPPYWDNTPPPNPAPVHWTPLAWPDDSEWYTYTSEESDILDKRTSDPSNGGRAPQNYVNISSGCNDQTEDSLQWYYDDFVTAAVTEPTLFFRWRVEQIPNTYATGPTLQPASTVDPWKAAQWTVLVDIDGDGYREFAVNIYGASGSPGEEVDVMRSIYSDTRSQSIDFNNESDIHLLFDNPTAFVDRGTGIILNFRNSLDPTVNWPNGSAETVWDYGSSRSSDISNPTCSEYNIDYQIPLAMLDASSVGGPTVTADTPMCFTFVTANSNVNPLQKDVGIDATKSFSVDDCVPCGDLIVPSTGAVVPQPVVDTVTAAGCGPAALTARVRDAIDSDCQATLSTVEFYYYWDKNANGDDDDGEIWTFGGAAVVDADNPGDWTLSWDSTSLNAGQYLIGVRAEDNQGNVTWSHLTQAEVDAGPGGFANPAAVPGVVFDTFINDCGEYAEVIKSVNPASAAAGGAVQFTVTVDNQTSTAFDVTTITDTLPTGFTFEDTAPPAGVGAEGGTLAASIATSPADGDSGTVAWTFNPGATVAAGGTGTLTFWAAVPSVEGTYSNNVTAVTTDGDWTTLVADPVDIGVGSPQLTISKAASSYSVEANDTVTYTITYSNDSPVSTTGVVVTDVLPGGLVFVSASDGGTYAAGTRTITWNVPDLASLEGPYTLTYDVTVDKSASVATTNSAAIDSNETSPAQADVTIFVNSPMKITKTADKTLVYPGAGNPDDRIVYTITYQNTGSANLTGVTITDTNPYGLYYIAHTTDANFTSATVIEPGGDGHGDNDAVCEVDEPCTVTWGGPGGITLAAGASGSVTFTVQAMFPYLGSSYTDNIADMAATGAPTVSDNALVGAVEPGGICDAFFFHNETVDTGWDGLQYVSDTNIVESTDNGTGIAFTAQPGSNPGGSPPDNYQEVVRFYNPPAVNDEPIVDSINTRIYFDRTPGLGLWVQGEIFDYDPVTGATTSLGSQSQEFNGNLTGLHEFTITPTGGTLLAGHRLLWVFSVQASSKTKTRDVYFQFDGWVINAETNPATSTFASAHARLCGDQPSLIISKKVDNATAVAGDTLVYTILFSNLGVDNATSAQVVDVLPTGTTFVSATLNGAAAVPAGVSGQEYTFDVNSTDTGTTGQVTGGESGTLVITVTVDNPLDSGISTLTNTSTIDSAETAPVSDAVTTTVSPPVAPNLKLFKSVSSTMLIPGDTATYSILVLNVGLATSGVITVTDLIPANAYFTYVAASIAGGDSRSDAGAPTLTWTINSLAPGGTVTLTYQMYADNTGLVPAGVNVIANDASAVEGVTAYTSNSINVTISSNANLQITKSTSPAGPVSPGDSVEYTVTVSSIGGSTATGVAVRDPIPSDTAYSTGTLIYQGAGKTDEVDGDEGSFDGATDRTAFQIGDLSAGESRTMKFSVVVDSPLSDGTTTVTNTAVVSAGNTASKNGIAAIDAEAAPVLNLSKTAPTVVPYPLTTLSVASPAPGANDITVTDSRYLNSNDVIYLGGNPYQVTAISGNVVTLDQAAPVLAGGTPVLPTIQYMFSYSNTGDADATNVVIRDTLTPGLTYVAGYSSGLCVAGTPVECTIGTLAAGETGLLSIRVVPGATGSYTNFGKMLSDELDTFDSNTVTTVVGGIELSKATVPVGPVTVVNDPGDGTPEPVTYAITITPQVGIPLTGIEVTDVLPIAFVYNSTTSYTGGGTCPAPAGEPTAGDSVLVWTGCSIPAGNSLTITFVVDIGVTVSAGTYDNPVEAVANELEVFHFDELITTAEDVIVTVPSDIKVTKNVASVFDPCVAGVCQVTYEIMVENMGSNPTGVVTVTDLLEANLTYLSDTNVLGVVGVYTPPPGPAPGGTIAIPNLTVCSVDAANCFSIHRITATVTNFGATITNCAILASPLDNNPSNDQACVDLIPTRVILADFGAYEDGGGKTVVEWTTAVEIDTAGFHLFRLNRKGDRYRQLNSRLLPAAYGAMQGGEYSLIDESADPEREQTYMLVEAETNGVMNTYGPFTVRPADWTGPSPAGVVTSGGGGAGVVPGYTLKARGQARKAERSAAGRKAKLKARSARISKRGGKGGALKIAVVADGLYFVAGERIASLLGLSGRKVRSMIKGGRLSLTSGGRAVAVVPAGDLSGLFFFGRESGSRYSAERIYWLAPGKAAAMEEYEGALPDSAGATTFRETLHVEEEEVLLNSSIMDADSDYFFWAYLVAGYPALESRTFAVEAPGVAGGGGTAALTVNLQGFTNTPASPDHHVEIRLNGVFVGDDRWEGTQSRVLTMAVAQGLLREMNTVEVKALLDTGAAYSVFYIDSFDLSYRRRTEAVGDTLVMVSEGESPVTVSGFTGPDVFVLDVTDPDRPLFDLSAVVGDGGSSYAVTFVPTGPGRRYLVATGSAGSEALSLWADSPSDLASRRRGADYVVIAPGELVEAAGELVRYRQGQGLESMLVDLEDVMDEFNHGLSSPEAIRDFLRFARRNWDRPPRFVLLAGEGTFDYRDRLGWGDNLVPIMIADTPHGLFPADNLFADFDGDHVPEMAVGRLPVVSPEELRLILDKIRGFESSVADRVIMLADNDDSGGNFTADMEDAALLIPPRFQVSRISLNDHPVDFARELLLSQLAEGAYQVNYIGHGGVDRLAQEGLLRTVDVDSMPATECPPVMAAMTCAVGLFALPGYDSLSEALLLKRGGGATAVWSPAGLSFNALARTLNQDFLKAAYSGEVQHLGDALLRALADYHASGGPVFMLDIYNLLGDPALKLR